MTRSAVWDRSIEFNRFCDTNKDYDMVFYLGTENNNFVHAIINECPLNTKIAWLLRFEQNMKNQNFRYNY